MKHTVLKSLILTVFAVSTLGANAADAPVTNNVIMGTGITNGGFTVGTGTIGPGTTGGGVEVGLRGRERYDLVTNLPSNVTGSNNNGTYNQNAGEPPGFTGIGQNRARWNFDWSVNTDSLTGNPSGKKVGDFTYLMVIDFDPSPGFIPNPGNFLAFNPITSTGPFPGTACADHSFGNNLTGQSGGTEVTCPNDNGYANLLAENNLVQNSWNLDFFDELVTTSFDPNASGTYTISFDVFNENGRLAGTSINVIVGAAAVVPEPGSLALVGLALTGLVVLRRRKL